MTSISLPRQRCKSPLNTLPPTSVLGFRKDGRPIFPIAGGSEPPKQDDPPKGDPPKSDPPKDSGPKMVTDEDGTALYPANTAVAEMTAEQRANYWRAESKKQQRLREEAERKAQGSQNGDGSGTVRDQQQSSSDSEAAVRAAEAKGRREAAKDAVLVTITTTLQSRGKKTDEITELLDVVNPDKFLDDNGKIDGTKVANYVARVAPASGSQNDDSSGGNPGQGNHQQQGGMSARDRAKAEAERRGLTAGNVNRGALGGLRK